MNRWRARLAELQGDAFTPAAHVQNVQIVQNSASVPAFEHFEQIEHRREPVPTPQPDTWTDAQEVRAAIVEYEAGAPRAWAEGFAWLDPKRPPADVLPRRWLRFIDDFGAFLDGGGAIKAAACGWGPLDLFGADRERPFARVANIGLLWLVNGGRVVELHRDRAVIETTSGALLSHRRRPVEVGRVVLAWELDP
jgi:hypothetical protein